MKNNPDSSREDVPGDGAFNRRNLLKVSAMLGGGGLISQTAVPTGALAQQPAQSGAPRLTEKDVLAKAR
ncbi:MAG: twin-arginine translocation signal domain-containing protein [Bryobacteraceae bacterium]|jgi:hypothetical protein